MPLTNEGFLNAISRSFEVFLEKGTSRSTDKLKPLHGAIAADIAERLGADYEVWSQGYGSDKEAKINGRYIDKMVDVTIKRDGQPVAGIAVKFIMQNYSQNSNNYFEGMLGETANIRCTNCPYFQVFIVIDKLPYYDKDKQITKWQYFTDHNFAKYVVLSNDDTDVYFHTPNKTLVYVVHVPDSPEPLHNHSEYLHYYRTHDHSLSLTDHRYAGFGRGVILNNYETFIRKVYHTIMAI